MANKTKKKQIRKSDVFDKYRKKKFFIIKKLL